MGSGPTAEVTGITTGRTTGMRASSGRQVCTMPISKPTSLTCWPRPAKSRSTEGTERPGRPQDRLHLGWARAGCRPPIRLRCPQQPISAAVGRGFPFLANLATQGTFGPAVSTNHGLGMRRASNPSPHPALDKSFFTAF